jgi:hypothetical protein
MWRRQERQQQPTTAKATLSLHHPAASPLATTDPLRPNSIKPTNHHQSSLLTTNHHFSPPIITAHHRQARGPTTSHLFPTRLHNKYLGHNAPQTGGIPGLPASACMCAYECVCSCPFDPPPPAPWPAVPRKISNFALHAPHDHPAKPTRQRRTKQSKTLLPVEADIYRGVITQGPSISLHRFVTPI